MSSAMLIPFGARWLRLAMLEGVLAGQVSALNNQADSEGNTAALVDLDSDSMRLQLLHAASAFSLRASEHRATVAYRAIPLPLRAVDGDADADVVYTLGTVREEADDLLFTELGSLVLQQSEIVLDAVIADGPTLVLLTHLRLLCAHVDAAGAMHVAWHVHEDSPDAESQWHIPRSTAAPSSSSSVSSTPSMASIASALCAQNLFFRCTSVSHRTADATPLLEFADCSPCLVAESVLPWIDSFRIMHASFASSCMRALIVAGTRAHAPAVSQAVVVADTAAVPLSDVLDVELRFAAHASRGEVASTGVEAEADAFEFSSRCSPVSDHVECDSRVLVTSAVRILTVAARDADHEPESLLFVATVDSRLHCFSRRMLVAQWQLPTSCALHLAYNDVCALRNLGALPSTEPLAWCADEAVNAVDFYHRHLDAHFRPQLQLVASPCTLLVVEFDSVVDRALVHSYAHVVHAAHLHPLSEALLITQSATAFAGRTVDSAIGVCEYEPAEDEMDTSMRLSRVYRLVSVALASPLTAAGDAHANAAQLSPSNSSDSTGLRVVLESLERRVRAAERAWIAGEAELNEKRRLVCAISDRLRYLVGGDSNVGSTADQYASRVDILPALSGADLPSAGFKGANATAAFELLRLDSYYEIEARMWAFSAYVDVRQPLHDVRMYLQHAAHSVSSRSHGRHLEPTAAAVMLSAVCTSDALPHESCLDVMLCYRDGNSQVVASATSTSTSSSSFSSPALPSLASSPREGTFRCVCIARVRVSRTGGHCAHDIAPPERATTIVPQPALHAIGAEATMYVPLRVAYTAASAQWPREHLAPLLRSLGLAPATVPATMAASAATVKEMMLPQHWISRFASRRGNDFGGCGDGDDDHMPKSHIHSGGELLHSGAYVACSVRVAADAERVVHIGVRALCAPVLERFVCALLRALTAARCEVRVDDTESATNESMAALVHRSVVALSDELTSSIDAVSALLHAYAARRQAVPVGVDSAAAIERIDIESICEYQDLLRRLAPLQERTDALFALLLSAVA